MNDPVYFDTSALAKWYINEKYSDAVEAFLSQHGPVVISSLTVIEMRSLLARRRRSRDFDAEMEMRIMATFEEDIRQGHLIRHALSDDLAEAAVNIVSMLPHLSLRTLDAMHLAVCQKYVIGKIATADRIMADAATAMNIEVITFGLE